MRGRSGCPTGQEKNSVGATGESLSDFLQGKVGYRVAPSSDPASPAHLPPEGKALGVGAQRVENFLSQKCFPAYFFRKNASQIGLSIPEVTAPLSYQRQRSPKRANESERAMNPGSRGGAPALFFPISREKWGPPPGRRGPRGAAPQGRLRSCPPEGYAPPPAPPHTGVWLTRAATARAARTPEAPAWASPRVIPAPSPAAKKLGRAVSRSGESFSRAE